MVKKLIYDNNAESVTLGQIFNFMILVIITGGIISAFYIREEYSSRHAMQMGFTDTANQIARDITNIYIITTLSNNNNNVDINIRRNIPLTIGGKGYSIELKNSENDYLIDVKEEGNDYKITTHIDSINSPMNIGGMIHSGSGEINITATKNNSGTWLWIN